MGNQLLLRTLRAEVAASEQTFSAHDGQHHVMADARGGLTSEEVVR